MSQVKKIDNKYTQNRRVQVKVERVVRRRLIIFGGILLAILLMVSLLALMQMKENHDLHAAQAKETAKLKKLQNEEIALKEKLKQLNSKEYITKIARSEYFLSNDGEIIFKIPNQTKKNE